MINCVFGVIKYLSAIKAGRKGSGAGAAWTGMSLGEMEGEPAWSEKKQKKEREMGKRPEAENIGLHGYGERQRTMNG